MIEQLIALLFILFFYIFKKIFYSSSLGMPRHSQPDEIWNLSRKFWVCPEVDVPGKLEGKLEAPRRHPVQMPKPPQMAPFDTEEQWLHSELPLNVRAHHSIFEAEPSHPTEPFGSASPWWTQYCWRHSKPPVHITLPKCMELVLLHLPHRSPPSPDRHC